MNTLLRTARVLPGLLAAFVFTGFAAAQTETAATYIVQGNTLDSARSHVRRVGAEPERELDIIHAVAASLTPAQVARLRAEKSVRVYDDREVKTRGWLLKGLQDLINDLNTTLAQTTLVKTVQTVAAPVVSTVACNPLVSSLTSPLVQTTTSLQSSTQLGTLPLVYETNYPEMIGADDLHCDGVTGRGITIAVLDTGLWQDTFQFYGDRVGTLTDPFGHVWSIGTHREDVSVDEAKRRMQALMKQG